MKVAVFALLGVLSIALYSQQSQPTRVGMIIGIKPDKISAYEALHAASNQGVRDLLDKYHMHNFSIYIQKIGRESLLPVCLLRIHREQLQTGYGYDGQGTSQYRLAQQDGRHADSVRGRKHPGPRCRRSFTILDKSGVPIYQTGGGEGVHPERFVKTACNRCSAS